MHLGSTKSPAALIMLLMRCCRSAARWIAYWTIQNLSCWKLWGLVTVRLALDIHKGLSANYFDAVDHGILCQRLMCALSYIYGTNFSVPTCCLRFGYWKAIIVFSKEQQIVVYFFISTGLLCSVQWSGSQVVLSLIRFRHRFIETVRSRDAGLRAKHLRRQISVRE